MIRSVHCLVSTPFGQELNSFNKTYERIRIEKIKNNTLPKKSPAEFITTIMKKDGVYGTQCEHLACCFVYEHQLTGECKKLFQKEMKIE